MITKLKARGMIGIQRATGLDEIEIDFTGREGIIALAGKNGAGKSSVIDMLHPYDCLASRDGALKNFVTLRDSFVDLSMTHMGHHYRKLLKIDAQSGKSEGYAYIDGSAASVVPGGISEYKKWAAQTFGSEELFFASNFKAQGATDVSKMTAGKLKALFAEFLRLDRYEKWADTAKQAGNVLTGQAETVGSRIDTLLAMVAGKAALEEEYGSAGEKTSFLLDDKALLTHDLEEKRKSVDTLKATIQVNALALERKKDLQGQIDRMAGELAKEKQAAEKEIFTLTEKYREIRAAILVADGALRGREMIEKAAENVQELESGLTGLVATVEEENQNVPAYQKRCHVLEIELAELRQKVKDLDSDPGMATLEREIVRLTAQLGNKWDMTKALGDRDEACVSETCSFIVGALAAQKELPALEEDKKKLEGKMAEWARAAAVKKLELAERITSATTDLTNAKKLLAETSAILEVHQRTLAGKRAEVANQKSLAGRLPEIRVAEQRKGDLEKQLAEVTKAGTERKTAWNETEAGKSETLRGYRETRDAISFDESAQFSLNAAFQEIRDIETVKLPAVEKEIQAARDRIAKIQADLSRIEGFEKELVEARVIRDALMAKIARWKYLQIGCGQNGLQALEIDGATPAINERANKLLYQGYGPEFTIKVITQDEKGKECLDILVISENGEEPLSLKSGGEKVWLLQPIRLAMALLNREKSGREFDMAFFDESDGPLDAEGSAQNYMQMYKPFMEMGGIRQVFLVTHKPECLAYCDHVLRFEKGKHPVWE
jgi:exonuclease SbcC